MRILYVEDDPHDADLTVRALRKSAPHLQLETVTTVGEALARFEEIAREPLDLVMTDMHLRDGDGLSLLRHVRERAIPVAVVLITGMGDEETAVAALKARADDYVVKRRDYLDRLPAALEGAVGHYRADAARRARPLHILYAEEEAGVVEATRRHLAVHADHLRLEAIPDGQAALQALRPGEGGPRCDVLLLSLDLEEPNALEVLWEMRGRRRQDVPVVLVCREGDEDLARRALNLGASSYLVKRPGYLYQLAWELEEAHYRADLLRREAALRQTQGELARMSRVTALGELAASIAHEVNQPLASIVGNAEICLTWLDVASPNLAQARDAVSDILADGLRAAEVLRRIRTLVSKGVAQKTRLDINEVVGEVTALLAGTAAARHVKVRLRLGGGLTFVVGDRVQLQQVLLNLLMNAMDAVSVVDEARRELVVETDSGDEGGVRVTVRDHGPGLSPGDAEKVFGPFFTTKPEGMGMGLPISRSIIRAHGGRLWAEANDGGGACFRFTLPPWGDEEP